MRTMHSNDEPSQEFSQLVTYEQVDFRRAYEALREYVRLERLQEQQSALVAFCVVGARYIWRLFHLPYRS
jgi:hypothetical protein